MEGLNFARSIEVILIKLSSTLWRLLKNVHCLVALLLQVFLHDSLMSGILPSLFMFKLNPQFCYSNFREIPDNQEVLVDEKTDQSLIVELLSMDDTPDSEVIHKFFS